ncbi:MAG: gliding motility protein GldN [Bacteroidales bacterium]|jgi:gliding motility associated protien GldN|nr:gliding motility protein GldN [Bacteroidales bacterium]
MKKLILVLIIGFALFAMSKQKVNAQNVRDNIYTKENIRGKRPIPYRVLREADIMWSKKIWQEIDCRKKMNHPIYFPTEDMDDRKSLISLLIYGINNEGLTAFKDDEFHDLLTRDEVYGKFDALPKKQIDPMTGDSIIIPGEIRFDEVKSYLLKEQWYFDKQHSTLRIRILGICPIRKYIDLETEQPRKMQTFWIYFDEVRPALASQEVFNKNNDAQRISYDDLFFQRRFSSYIIQETNVYDNRPINNYMQGKNVIYEADMIKQELFEFEHDLWEY